MRGLDIGHRSNRNPPRNHHFVTTHCLRGRQCCVYKIHIINSKGKAMHILVIFIEVLNLEYY